MSILKEKKGQRFSMIAFVGRFERGIICLRDVRLADSREKLIGSVYLVPRQWAAELNRGDFIMFEARLEQEYISRNWTFKRITKVRKIVSQMSNTMINIFQTLH